MQLVAFLSEIAWSVQGSGGAIAVELNAHVSMLRSTVNFIVMNISNNSAGKCVVLLVFSCSWCFVVP